MSIRKRLIKKIAEDVRSEENIDKCSRQAWEEVNSTNDVANLDETGSKEKYDMYAEKFIDKLFENVMIKGFDDVEIDED
jgi:hypothetical protein